MRANPTGAIPVGRASRPAVCPAVRLWPNEGPRPLLVSGRCSPGVLLCWIARAL